MDEIKRRQIECYLDEDDEEYVWGGESSDDNNSEINEELHSNHNTDSEQSDATDIIDDNVDTNNTSFSESFHESDDDIPLNMRVQCFYGKNSTKWYRKKPNQKKRIGIQNKVTEKPGVQHEARNAKNEIDAWNLFISEKIIETIVNCTNIYIAKIRTNFARDRDATNTNVVEIKALIGCLYMIGKLFFS